jgi:hypothetical protein
MSGSIRNPAVQSVSPDGLKGIERDPDRVPARSYTVQHSLCAPDLEDFDGRGEHLAFHRAFTCRR